MIELNAIDGTALSQSPAVRRLMVAIGPEGWRNRMSECRLSVDVENRKRMPLAAAALLVFGLSTSTARAEDAAVPKQIQLERPSADNKPPMTADEQEKLKKELIKARDRQSQVKAKESAAPAKAKKP